MKIGFCCSTYEQCPRESRYCSTDLAVSKTLQQFICPFEPFCGSATPNLTATETPQTLRVLNNTSRTSGVFANNNFCQYTFSAPRAMRESEQILITVNQLYLSEIDLVISRASDMRLVSTEQRITSAGSIVRVGSQDQAYMVVRSIGTGSTFNFTYSFIASNISISTQP